MSVKIGLKFIDIWGDSMEDAVCEYEKEEIKTGGIVFYGPSNFTRWSAKYGHRPLSEDLIGASGARCCINRGFGSSCSEHHLYYYDRMVRPLKPKVLVYSFYGNAKAFGYSVEENWELAQRVIAYAKTDFPDIKIYIVGGFRNKSTASAVDIRSVAQFDMLVSAFCKENDCTFIEMQSREQLHGPELFVEDKVHYNQKGYDLYGKVFKEVLADELAKY
jgi:hypothetical protein